METGKEKDAKKNARFAAAAQHALYAQTPKGITIGVVCDSEPSSLTLLAAGVAGMAARRAHGRRAK